MTSLIDCPQDERGTLRFGLFGIPVRVLPWFWLTTFFTGASNDTGLVLIWIAVVFVSILIHELGHVLAYRAFGTKGEILLYGWGGLAVPLRGRAWNTFQQVVVSAAGPMAGFCLAACALPVSCFVGRSRQSDLSHIGDPLLDRTAIGRVERFELVLLECTAERSSVGEPVLGNHQSASRASHGRWQHFTGVVRTLGRLSR